VIDALCHHESDLHIREHYTDTGGSTEQVFALATLLGFRFAPRISDALAKKLYVLDAVEPSEPLKTLLFEQVNKKLIMEQWDEMQRVASSIRHAHAMRNEMENVPKKSLSSSMHKGFSMRISLPLP